jgi:c-di-GMP-binding flagellar brake protein YcgR
MFPLEIDYTAFWKEDTTPIEIIIFSVLVAIVIVYVIIANKLKGKIPTGKAAASSGGGGRIAGGGGALPGVFSGFKIHRLAKNVGLSREQIKMLDFVFKTDQVTDPEKSFNSPSLLDRHFKKAYRVIEQSSGSEAETNSRLSLLFSTRNMLENSVGGNLTSTTQLKDDTTLIINDGREKYSVPVVSTTSEHLTVECPKNAYGRHINLQKGSKFTILVFTKNNKSFSFETRVIGNSSKFGSDTLLLAHSNQLKFLSQRRYRRKQVVIPCDLFIVIVEGSGKKQRLIVDKRRLTGNIADISVGGCSIKIKAPIQVGAKLKIEFNHDNSNIAALGQVLRTNRTGIVTVIHIKFLKVTRKSMNIINAFVYEYDNG